MTAKACQKGTIRVDGKCKPSGDIGTKHGLLYDKKESRKNNITFKLLGVNTPWIEGYVGERFFQARVFDTPSKYGLKSGRISNLIILEGLVGRERTKSIYNYDRDLVSSTKKGRELAEKIRVAFPVIKK